MGSLTPAQIKSRNKYYAWLSKYDSSPYDSYDKPWLSTVTEAECFGAETLVDVMDDYQASTQLENEYTYTSPTIVPSMGHKFGPDATCHHCETSWEDHQRTQSACDKYVEPANAPQEDPGAVGRRVKQFDTLYEKPKKRANYRDFLAKQEADRRAWESRQMTVDCVGCYKNCSWTHERGKPILCYGGGTIVLKEEGEG